MYVYFKNIFICAYLYKDFIVFLLLLTFSTLFFDAWQILFFGGGGVQGNLMCVTWGLTEFSALSSRFLFFFFF